MHISLFFVSLSVFVAVLDCWQQYHATGECPVRKNLQIVWMCTLMGACSLLFWWENLVLIIGIGSTIRWGTTPAALDAEAVCAICMAPVAVSNVAKEGSCLAARLLLRLAQPPARRTLCCTHTVHSGCIKRWVARNPSCPVCRCAVLRAHWVVCCAAVEQGVLFVAVGGALVLVIYLICALLIVNGVF